MNSFFRECLSCRDGFGGGGTIYTVIDDIEKRRKYLALWSMTSDFRGTSPFVYSSVAWCAVLLCSQVIERRRKGELFEKKQYHKLHKIRCGVLLGLSWGKFGSATSNKTVVRYHTHKLHK